jgi:HPt (histidine-containing phosphotransfer) domain-containing protein
MTGAASATVARVPPELLDETTLDSLAALEQHAPAPFLQKLIYRFLDDLPEQVAAVARACALGDGERAEATAHSLAGAAAAVGASALTRAARAVCDDPTVERVAVLEAISRATVTALSAWTSRRAQAFKLKPGEQTGKAQ